MFTLLVVLTVGWVLPGGFRRRKDIQFLRPVLGVFSIGSTFILLLLVGVVLT